MPIFIWIIQPVVIISPLFVGVIRKMKAKFQNRRGANIFQPYMNLWKLFHKDEVISSDASWIFKYTPYILFAITIAVSLIIPFLTTFAPFQSTSDFLVIIYLLAIGTFYIALAGMDTGNAFGGTGSSREMTIAASAEAGFILSILPLVIISKSTNLFTITQSILHTNSNLLIGVGIAFVAFVIILLAETNRYPFDNPSTHLELTMIHEAMVLEYSGKRLALMEWAASNKLLIFMILGINMFLPWGISESFTFGGILLAFCFMVLKISMISLFIAILESFIAKYRFFRLPQLLLSSTILGIIAIVLII